jgi:hypothetical protein
VLFAIVCLERRPHRSDAAMEAGLRGSGGDAEDPADLSKRKSGIVMEHHYRALVEIESREPAVERIALGDQEIVADVDPVVLRDDAQLNDRTALFTPGMPVAGPNEQPVQPRIEPLRIPQPADVSPGLDERLLGCVLRSVAITKDQAGDRVQSSERARDERREGLMIAFARPLSQIQLHRRPPSSARLLWSRSKSSGMGATERFPNRGS